MPLWMWQEPTIRKGVRYLTCFSITKKVAASHHEFSYAQLEGVQFEYNKAPVEITDEGVIFKDMAEDEEGRLTEIPGSETLYPADSVIISISQGPQNRIVNTTEGLAADAKGLLVQMKPVIPPVPASLPPEMW